MKHGKCKHGTRTEYCKLCGGSQICKHLKHKDQCRECGGSSFCVHDRWRPRCFECKPDSTFRQYVHATQKRGVPFTLTQTEFLELLSGVCQYCGQTPAGGIDRLDSDYAIGYVEGNVVSCCSVCNKMKMILSPESFLAQVRRIAEWQKFVQ